MCETSRALGVTSAVVLVFSAFGSPAAWGQVCLNDREGHLSEVCVVDPTDLSGRAGDQGSTAFDRPARRLPRDATSSQGFPLAVSGFEVEGSPPTGGQVLDVVFIDQAGVWVVPNNDPAVSLLKIPVEEANAYLEIPLADLLFECTTPPCAATMPNVTAAFLERGNFDGIGDDNDDLAVYIQTDANPTGPEGTLVYLKVASGGGLEVMRRHPTIGRDAVDMVVAKFDSDDTDDVALLFDTSIKVVRASGLTPWVQSANLKNTVALAVTDLDQTGDNDLVVLGRGDTTNTTLFWLAWNTGTGLTNPVSFTMRIANDDIVTDIAMERLLSDTNHLVVLITAEQGDEGRLYFYPIVSTVFTPLLPDPAVDSFSGGAKRILLADVGPQTPRRFLDAENLTVPLATDIIVKDGARDVLVLGDGAPFVDEMGAEKNLRVGMLTLFQGPFTEALVTTQSEIAPSFEGFLRVYLESSQWRLASLLDPDVAVPSMPNRNVTGIAIGDFDLTEGPDIVISDAENGELVFLRAQPPPCATYVTLVAHGHLGVESHYPPQLPFPYQENVDLMLSSLSERVQLVNDLRRPGSPTEDDLCAIRHLEVRGHWEEGTRAPLYADPLRPESGQLMVGAARVLWVGSQYGAGGVLLPAHPPATLVGATPTTYWVSFLYRLNPAATWSWPMLDARAGFGVLGAASELLGFAATGPATDRVVEEFQSAMLVGTSRARMGMDACDGQLFVDATGYSRGAPVISRTFDPRGGDFARSALVRFNAKVRVSYIDAIDRLHSFQPVFRPWALSGDIENDGYVDRRGNESISSFWAATPSTLPAWGQSFVGWAFDQFEAGGYLNPNDYPSHYRDTHILSMPLGWDRSQDVGPHLGLSFNQRYSVACPGSSCAPFNADESFAGPVDESHSHMHWKEDGNGTLHGFFAPTNITGSTLQGAPATYSHASTSSLGVLLLSADAGRNAGLPLPQVGWAPRGARNRAFDEPFFRSGTDELADLPDACGGNSLVDPLSVQSLADALGSSLCTFNGDGPAAHCNASQELISDESLDASRSATMMSAYPRRFPKEKEDVYDALELPQATRDSLDKFALQTENVGLPVGGPWQQTNLCTDAGGLLTACPDGVVLAGGSDDHDARVRAAVSEGVSGADDDERAVNAHAELESLPPQAQADKSAYFSSVLAGATPGPADAYARFPDTLVGEIYQQLPGASKSLDELIVRIDFAITQEDGFLEVALEGDNLSEARRIGYYGSSSRHQETFMMVRSAAATSLNPDTIFVRGRGLNVYRVSVQPHRVLEDPATGRLYEMVYRSNGTSWDHAHELAEDLRYFDLHARLVPPTDATTMQVLLNSFDFEAPVWVGASRAAGDGMPFLMDDGTTVPGDLWAIAPPFSSTKRLYAALDPALGGLVPLTASVVNLNRPIGFLIEYVSESELTGEEDMCLAYAGVFSSWPLDAEDTGGSAFEIRGRYDMTTAGSLPVSGPGLFAANDSSVVFNGANVLTTAGDQAISDLFAAQDYTVSFWMRPDSTSGLDVMFRVGGDGTDDANGTQNVLMQIDRNGTGLRLAWEIAEGGNQLLYSSGLNLVAGGIYHVTVSVQTSPMGAGLVDVAMYVTHPTEGRVYEEVWLDQPRAVPGDPAVLTVDIGGLVFTSGLNFVGALDELAIYGLGMTSVEAWELAQSMLGGEHCGAFDSKCADHDLSSSGVVAAWLFDEATAGDVRELAHRYTLKPQSSALPGVTGSLNGGFAAGRGARSFVSSTTAMSSVVDAALYDELLSSDYSLSTWFRSTSGGGFLFYLGGPVGDDEYGTDNILLQLQLGSDGKLHWLWEVGTRDNFIGNTDVALTFDRVYHAVVTVIRQGSSADLRIDVRDELGNLKETKTWTGLRRPTTGDISRARVVVGGRTSSSGGFNGVIDDMTIFGTPLTPEQSQALFDGDSAGIQASWPLYENIADEAVVDAMGRYVLPRITTGLVPVIEGLQPHDILYAGARDFIGTPVSRPGNEHLSEVFADSPYTVTFLFRPSDLANSGSRAMFFYGGLNGDGYDGRDNYVIQVAHANAELELFWEYGIGYNVVMTTGALDLIEDHVYSVAVVVTVPSDTNKRNVLARVKDQTAGTAAVSYQWLGKPRAKAGLVSRADIGLGGRSTTGQGGIYYGALDEVHVFDRGLTTTEIDGLFAYAGSSEAVCAPSFVAVSPEARLLMASVIEEGDSKVQGPAAGDAQSRKPAEYAGREHGMSRASPAEEQLFTTDEQPAAEAGAEREVAYPSAEDALAAP